MKTRLKFFFDSKAPVSWGIGDIQTSCNPFLVFGSWFFHNLIIWGSITWLLSIAHWYVLPNYCLLTLWQYGLLNFQEGDTKLETFLPKNQYTQRKLLNFENWCSGEVSKSAKIWLSKSIFYVKNHLNFYHSFSLKNTKLGAYFLFLTFSDSINS